MCEWASGRSDHGWNFKQEIRRPFLDSVAESANHVILFAAVAALGLSLAGCSKNAPETEPLVAVKTALVGKRVIQQEVSAEAVIYPLHQASIVPKISAPIGKFYVERGDRVRAGQLLAVLENSDLQAAVAESKGAYQEAEANYQSVKAANLPEQIQTAKLNVKSAGAAFDAAQEAYASSEKLYQQGALAKKQLDQDKVAATQAKNQLETAQQHLSKLRSVGEKSQLKSAEGQLAAAKGRFENAQAQLSYTEIRSPINGVVTDRPLYPGEIASTSTPLITVMDISKIIARAHIPESQAGLLKVGDPATISVSAESKGLPGKVIVVSPALDPGSTTVQVWVEAPNAGARLKAGSTARVSLVARQVPDALVIPKSALLNDPEQGDNVMVVGSDGRAHLTKVETGIEQNGEVQILKGLQPGDRIVTEGAYGLPDDTKVKY